MDRSTRDVLIVGGGPAGLSAALYLGRSRKAVTVVDRGHPRHAVSAGVHNFLTREGMAPQALRETAWDQMRAYPSVTQRHGSITSLTRDGELWRAQTEDGATLAARAVLLATGVVDHHPQLPGYEARWGHSIHHCPYCHGWELREEPLAVLASGEAAAHLAPILRGWSDDVVVLTHGGELAADARAKLKQAGVAVFDAQVRALEGPGRELAQIHLEDGTTLERRGLFVAAEQSQVPLVRSLGLTLTDDGYVEADPDGATSIPMVWAAGDLTSRRQQVLEAAAQGARAATMINAALTMG